MKNAVNRTVMVKKTRYIVLGLLMSLSLSMSARMYTVGEKIYVNVNQSDNVGDWSQADAKLFIVLYQSTDKSNSKKWIHLTATGSGSKIFEGTLPSDIRSWYDEAYMVREDPNTLNIWNQSCEFYIPDNYNPETGKGSHINCLDEFYAKKKVDDDCGSVQSYSWKGYAPAANNIPSVSSLVSSGVKQEDVHICPSALGGPFSLRAKLNAAKTQYDYTIVEGHAWYVSTNGGNSWAEVETGRTGTIVTGIDDKIDLNDFQLPSSLPGGQIYYYLHSNILSGRRLLHITADAPKCDLDCEITTFETAISAVNADDNTYTLDGMVAFGKANGSLIISCDGKDTTIVSPKSPQVFSLHGVPAATEDGKKTTATAYFQGDQTNCSMTITIDVPNAKEAVKAVDVDSLTGKSIVLTPADYDPANTYVWLVNGDTVKGATQVLTIDPFSNDSTVTYTYKEYYPAAGSMDDLMENGSYEDETWNYGNYKQQSTISDYNFWGIFHNESSQANFYDTCSLADNEKSNGVAIVRNAYNFYPSYAKVTARAGAGTNFALIDAASDGIADKRAWYASTAGHPNLKLQAGTTYVLSFWAANINNYGEMDNAARFKFRIEKAEGGLIGESAELDLSKPEFRNNIWHQCSQTFKADQDCNNVTISVVNLNTNTLNTGNDFALDDIQFHPISSVSKVVKSQQQFIVTAHEPKIDAFTATVVPLGCDAVPNYTVKMHVEYQNPKGQLVIKDLTTNTDYPYTVPAVAFDTKATLDKDIVINGLTPVTHTWEAYFDEWTTAKITGVTTDSPVVPTIDTAKIAFSEPGCTDSTTTLSFDLDYTYQQDTFTYWVDALPKKGMTYSKKDETKQTLKNLQFSGIPADGKNNHVLHISFAGPNSCIKDYDLPAVPFSPVIDTVTITGTPTTVPCGTTAYDVNIAVTPHYATTSKNIILTYDSAGVTKTTAPIAITAFPYTLTLYNLKSGSSNTVYAAFSDTPDCTKDGTYTLPKMTSCIRDSVTRCESELPYYWPNDNYKPYSGVVGENKYGVGTDSLFLFVIATPQITTGTMGVTCDNESSIRIPFSITNGAPDSIDIVIGSNHYVGTISGTDIVFTRATELVAGDYSATVTVGTKGTACTSQDTVNFSIALGGAMYSKWTDVLFVSNADNKFIAYQWYENGVAMSGETMQRLYKPEGLPGTYYCRLTTTDGKTITTCEQSFDKVQPSRSAGQAPTQVIRKYRISPHVYIVQTETDGIIETRKILTPYE